MSAKRFGAIYFDVADFPVEPPVVVPPVDPTTPTTPTIPVVPGIPVGADPTLEPDTPGTEEPGTDPVVVPMAPVASQWKTLMSGTPLFDKTANVSIVNQTPNPAVIFLAYVVDPLLEAPAQEDYLLFYHQLAPFQTLHYPVLAVSEEARVMVWSSIPGVSAIATGYQDEA